MTVSVTTALPPIPPVHDIHASRPGKSKYIRGTIPVRLNLAGRETDSLNNDPEVRIRMAVYGYNDNKIVNFTSIFQQALAANNRQVKEFGEKTAAYAQFDKLFAKVKTEFSIIKKIAKIALRNQVLKTDQLGLGRKYGKDIPSVFSAMQAFYNNAIEDDSVLVPLSEFGFDKNKVAQFQNNFLTAQKKYDQYYKEQSEAVEATRIRDDKMAILDEWMMDYYTIAKFALVRTTEFEEEDNENQQ